MQDFFHQEQMIDDFFVNDGCDFSLARFYEKHNWIIKKYRQKQSSTKKIIVNNKSLIPEKRWSMGAKSQVPQLVGINPFEKKLNWDVFPQTVVKMRLCWKPPPSKAVRSTARILQEIEFPVFQMSGSCFSFGGGRGQLRPPEICFKKAFG